MLLVSLLMHIPLYAGAFTGFFALAIGFHKCSPCPAVDCFDLVGSEPVGFATRAANEIFLDVSDGYLALMPAIVRRSNEKFGGRFHLNRLLLRMI